MSDSSYAIHSLAGPTYHPGRATQLENAQVRVILLEGELLGIDHPRAPFFIVLHIAPTRPLLRPPILVRKLVLHQLEAELVLISVDEEGLDKMGVALRTLLLCFCALFFAATPWSDLSACWRSPWVVQTVLAMSRMTWITYVFF